MNNLKKYNIHTSEQAVCVYCYTVFAESKEDAKSKFLNGECIYEETELMEINTEKTLDYSIYEA